MIVDTLKCFSYIIDNIYLNIFQSINIIEVKAIHKVMDLHLSISVEHMITMPVLGYDIDYNKQLISQPKINCNRKQNDAFVLE